MLIAEHPAKTGDSANRRHQSSATELETSNGGRTNAAEEKRIGVRALALQPLEEWRKKTVK
jgi:hypothetical protein